MIFKILAMLQLFFIPSNVPLYLTEMSSFKSALK